MQSVIELTNGVHVSDRDNMATYIFLNTATVIERDDGSGYGLMHAERGPSGGTGRKYYDNHFLLVRRIIISIYHGQAPRSQKSQAEHSFLCSTEVVNKEIDSLQQQWSAA